MGLAPTQMLRAYSDKALSFDCPKDASPADGCMLRSNISIPSPCALAFCALALLLLASVRELASICAVLWQFLLTSV